MNRDRFRRGQSVAVRQVPQRLSFFLTPDFALGFPVACSVIPYPQIVKGFTINEALSVIKALGFSSDEPMTRRPDDPIAYAANLLAKESQIVQSGPAGGAAVACGLRVSRWRNHPAQFRKEIAMTLPAQKFSRLFFAKVICMVTLVLFVVVFGAGAMLAQNQGPKTQINGSTTATAAQQQVSFTATATAAITGVTKLPNGVTQINFDTSGSATHLGNFTGPLTRLQDNQGNFGSTAVIVGANGKDSIFFSVSGTFEGKGGGNKCVVTSTGIYTITGGAGAFVNATGSGTITTQFDLCANTASGTYTGTISQPNTN